MDSPRYHDLLFLLFLQKGSEKALGFHVRNTGFDLKSYSLFSRLDPSFPPEVPPKPFALKRTEEQLPVDRLHLHLQILIMKVAILPLIYLYLPIQGVC